MSYRVKLGCGHGRQIVKGSDEDLDATRHGWAFCFRCKTTEAIAGWVDRGYSYDEKEKAE